MMNINKGTATHISATKCCFPWRTLYKKLSSHATSQGISRVVLDDDYYFDTIFAIMYSTHSLIVNLKFLRT